MLFSSVWPQIQSCLGLQSAGTAAQLMKLHYDSNFSSLNTKIIKSYPPSPQQTHRLPLDHDNTPTQVYYTGSPAAPEALQTDALLKAYDFADKS